MKDNNQFKGIINVASGTYSYDLTFGYNKDASEKYDKSVDKYAPPPPPPSFFDTALNRKGERYYSKIANMNDLEYYIMLQYGKDKKIVIKWDNSNWDNSLESCKIQDIAEGKLGVDIDMLKESTITLTNNNITKLKLKLIKKESE
jgi:hypothetical protein